MPDLSIIIANYNTKDLLKNCLDSIIRYKDKLKVEVIVVDNGSTDSSLKMLTKYSRKLASAARKTLGKKGASSAHIRTNSRTSTLKTIKNRANLLYSKANNQGLRKAKGEYVLILNSDTVMHKDTLPKMKKFMDGHPKCALSSCREVDAKGRTLNTCHRFPSPITELLEFPISRKIFPNNRRLRKFRYVGWDRRDIRQVDTVPGSFMFGRVCVLKKLGFFDENLPLFYSDADLCKRVKDAQWEIWHNGEVTITHYAAKSLEKFSIYKTMKLSYSDMVAYYKKHFGVIWATIIFLLGRFNLAFLKLRHHFVSKN